MNIVSATITGFYKILKMAIAEFIEDNAVQFGASLAFYTLFAAAPIIIIVISLAGIFYGADAVQGKIYGQINGLVGHGAAVQIQEIIKNIKASENGNLGALIGVIILLVAATGVFTEIQYSINYMWAIKVKPKKGWLKIIKNRLLSFSLILGLGFILLISLVVSALLDLISDKLITVFPNVNTLLFHFFDTVFIFLVTTSLFTVIFKVLPDARIKWRDAFTGSCFTSFLFLIGKYLISFYLANSTVSATYGAAASMVIILLWVYYSSNILFFGAAFTKQYALHYGGSIVPEANAVFVIKNEATELELKSVRIKPGKKK